MKRSALALLVIALPTVCIAGDATPAPVVDIKSKETFAVVWDRLQNSGFKGVHEGLDWAALKTKHQPEIEAAADIRQLRKEINELLEDLKASHFALIPAEAMPESGKAPPPGDARQAEPDARIHGRSAGGRCVFPVRGGCYPAQVF